MYDLINNGSLIFYKFITIDEKDVNFKVSDDAKSLIFKLLEKDPGTRLGRTVLKKLKNILSLVELILVI